MNSYIINERPEGMSYEAYKLALKNQNKAMKKYKKGMPAVPAKPKQKKKK